MSVLGNFLMYKVVTLILEIESKSILSKRLNFDIMKNIKILTVTLAFIIGMVVIGIGQIYERTASLKSGETLHISFSGIFDGRYQEIILLFQKPNQPIEKRELGCVSAYTLACFNAENVGEYYFMDKRDYLNSSNKYNILHVKVSMRRDVIYLEN